MPGKKLVINTKKKYSGDTSVLSARLPIEIIRKIDKIAEKTGRNRNELVLLFIEFAIENTLMEEEK